ncbi:MAG: pilus assembly protein N-terminal domain-containing protein [Pirellulaceae bacterium]
MRLHSNCTSQKRTTHRALRLALAMALVGGPSAAYAVEDLPPACNAPLNYPEYAEAGLLPYPFESACRTSQAEQTEQAQRLVRLVGLQPKAFAAERGATDSQLQSTLPTLDLASMTPSVVAASATTFEDASLSSEAANLSGQLTEARQPPPPQSTNLVQSLALPTAADMPTLPSLPAVSEAASEVESLADSLSESLIDIEIPMDLVQGVPTTTTTGPAEMARQALPSTAPQLSARGSDTGLVQPTQPPQLSSAAAESVAPPSGNHQTASTTVALAPLGRIPELVQTSKSMSVTEPISTSPSVSLKLSDSPTAESTSSQAAVSSNESTGASAAGERNASLHMSSASRAPLKASPVSVQLPQRAPGMQVRVEGEPAPMMTAQAIRGSDRDLPTAPRPSMVPAPRFASDAPVELPSTGKKVKASFASRTIQLPDRESLALAETRQQNIGQPGETLSVGLQESQALSAEYPIVELSVEHPTICQLMQTDEKSVSLIGMRPGSTRIALITINSDGERQVEIHEVSVGTSSPTEGGLAGLAKDISRSVAKMVPHSDVEIVAYTDYLLVHGFTPYESDAKKILALVRKTSLVPVVDQLKTNER